MGTATLLPADAVFTFTTPGGREDQINFSDLLALGTALQYLQAAGSLALPGLAINGDPNTGVHSKGPDLLSLVAGALDCINIGESAGARQLAFYVTAPVSLQTGVAVSAGGVHAALVNLGLITA